MVSPEDLRTAAAAVVAALRPAVGLDPVAWEAPAGELAWSCRRTLDHVTDALLHYSGQLATRATGQRAFLRHGDPGAGVDHLVTLVETSAAVLAEVAVVAPASTRAWHPAGRADPEGWLAMGCDETLIHAGDVAEGLGLPFSPPVEVCRRVLRRLFPWAAPGDDAWGMLRWANGRGALPGHPRQDPDWWWHCAPLGEWDGSVARRTSPPGWR